MPVLVYIPSDPAVSVSPLARLAALPIAERVFRSACRAGYGRVIVAVATAAQADALDPAVDLDMRRIASKIPIDITFAAPDEWRQLLQSLPAGETVTAMGAGTVVSQALLSQAAHQDCAAGELCDVPAGDEWPVSGVVRVRALEAVNLSWLSDALHDRVTARVTLPSAEDVSYGRAALAIRIRNHEELAAAERTIRHSVIKSTDNKVARWNRRISLPISIALMRTPLTANQLSVLILALGLYSAWLFSAGTYLTMVLAALIGLAASVLDGSDGEIARLKYQESDLGCWIETIADYAFYITVFIGMTVGVARWTGMPIFYWVGGAALAGTLITFALLIYLRGRITAGQPDRLHAIAKARFNARPTWWTRVIWSVSMMGMRSAMPYAFVILAVTGLMPVALVLSAVGANTFWISLVWKFRDLTQPAAISTPLRQ